MRLWFSLEICGAPWKVLIANENEVPALKGNEGITSYRECAIYIADWLPPGRYPDVAIHELLHAGGFASGSQTLIPHVYAGDASPFDKEEAMVSAIAPWLTDSLVRAGLLKLPKIPKDPSVRAPRARRSKEKSS